MVPAMRSRMPGRSGFKMDRLDHVGGGAASEEGFVVGSTGISTTPAIASGD